MGAEGSFGSSSFYRKAAALAFVRVPPPDAVVPADIPLSRELRERLKDPRLFVYKEADGAWYAAVTIEGPPGRGPTAVLAEVAPPGHDPPATAPGWLIETVKHMLESEKHGRGRLVEAGRYWKAMLKRQVDSARDALAERSERVSWQIRRARRTKESPPRIVVPVDLPRS